MTQMNILLKKFRVLHPSLPMDARTLMKTPRSTSQVLLSNGSYVHVGFTNLLKTFCTTYPNDNHIKLQLHIDGFQLFKHSRNCIWSILARTVEPIHGVFVVGMFCGKSKPADVHEFLNPVINDLIHLIDCGYKMDDDSRTCSVFLDSVIADAPARAFIKQVKSHTGYYSCERCTIRGEYKAGKVIFPVACCSKRTDDTFRKQSQHAHHVGISPFNQLPVNMIELFPLDYMHMICLGVTKRLVDLWRKGSIHKPGRLGRWACSEVNSRLNVNRKFLTIEFSRKCRDWTELEHWKATEFRQFLLYLGPVVLKGILDEKQYENFLNISVCTYLLCSEKYCKYYVQHVHLILRKTVEQLAALYGDSELTYNLHNMVHICEDVQSRGNLDNFSAFPFESYIGRLHRMVSSPTLPASQIYRRIIEREKIDIVNILPERVPSGCIEILGRMFSSKEPNNHLLVDSRPASIVEITSSGLLVQYYLNVRDFFDHIVPSNHVGIYRTGVTTTDVESVDIQRVNAKCLRLSYNDSYIFYPINHTM